MIDNKIHYPIKEKVTIKIDEQFIAEGIINIEEGMIPYVETNYLQLCPETNTTVHCSNEHRNFTLYNCEFSNNLIYPDLIAFGKLTSLETDALIINISGLAEWFLPKIGFKIEDRIIKKDIVFSDINFDIGEDLIGGINYICNISNEKSGLTEIKEDIQVKISSSAGIKINLIEEYAINICNLFSLLIGHPLDITSAFIKHNNKNIPLYFINISNKKENLLNSRHYLTPFPKLMTDKNLWGHVFKIALLKGTSAHNRFIDLWSRLPALQRVPSLWEYEVLGYVSIIDKFTDLDQETPYKLPKSTMRKIKDNIIETLKNTATSLDLKDNTIVKSLENYILNFKNTDTPTLMERFQKFIQKTDSRIIEIIDLSHDDFKKLKDLRDCVAHGKPVFVIGGRDISYEMNLKDKLTLLIYHNIYLDLGLDTEDYITSLNQTIHTAKRGASIDKSRLDKHDKRIPKIRLNQEDFDKLFLSKAPLKILKLIDNHYSFLEEESNSLNINDLSENGHSNIIELLSHKLCIEKELITYINIAYFISAAKEQSFYQIYTINENHNKT